MTVNNTNLYQAVFVDDSKRNNTNESIAAINLGREGSQVSYDQLRVLVDDARGTMHVGAGEKVALVMPNSLELIIGLLAVWAQGAAAAPLNPSYTSAELKALFDDLGVKKAMVLPGADEVKGILKEASADVEIVEVSTEKSEEASSRHQAELQVNLDNNTALYLHTSGTTGKPKAVPLSHLNLLRGAQNVAETYSLDSTHRTYLLQVLFHIHGIVAALLAPLITGGSIVIPPGGSLDASRAWSDFGDHDCTWVTGTPSILQTLLAAPCPDPVPDIHFIRSCSSPLLPTVFDALRKRFDCPVLEAYAMTEASHQMCSNRLDLFTSGTVGPESGGTKICIWDGGNEACELGAEGEVSVCGDNLMAGYEGVSEETNEKAFWHGTDERGNEARWFRTGDRGVLSTDGNRRLTLIGRSSEMVNRGGEKISPVEVDEALMLAADDLKEAACFAVPNGFYGQEIEAAVVLKPGSDLNEEKLQRLLEERLAKFKVPKRIHFCEDRIPKGPTGKIQRKNLAESFGDEGKAKANGNKGVEISDAYDIIDEALGLASGQAKKQPEATLLELGADSMGLAKIATIVKKRTGTHLDMASLFSFPSVEKLIKMAGQGTRGKGDDGKSQSKPAAFSLLPFDRRRLEEICQEADVKIDDLEDAFPLSASQKMYFDIFLGDHQNDDIMWMLNRYKIAKRTEMKRLVRALEKLQGHEESLRWTIATDPDVGWITLQLRPGVDNRVEELHCKTEDEAMQALEDRLSVCKHTIGVKTVILFVIKIDEELELAFIESHGFTEGQGRSLVLDSLNKAYNDEPMEVYPSYTIFVEQHPAGRDARHALDFWQRESAAAEYSEGSDWQVKSKSLMNPADLGTERLDLLGVEKSVDGPFNKLTVQVSMSLPLVVESVFALSLALYLAQQDEAFARGHVVYDRAISLRTADPQFSALRALTQGYHPNFLSLDLAKASLWTYLQHSKAITRLREQNVCINSTKTIANHSAAFTWRFNDDDDENEKDDSTAPVGQIVTGVKGEQAAFQAFVMCYVNANRKGANGVTIAIGFHQKWLDDQRRQGSKVALIDIYIGALRFFAERHMELHKLSWQDLQQAIMAPA